MSPNSRSSGRRRTARIAVSASRMAAMIPSTSPITTEVERAPSPLAPTA